MALLFMDGFDHYATGDVLKKWSAGNPTISAAAGRRGGGAMTLSNSSSQTVRKTLTANYQTLIVGAAFSFSTATPGQAFEIIWLLDVSSTQFVLRMETNGKLSVYRGTTLLTTASTALSANTFYYIELKVKVDPSTGTYEVRVNGSSSGQGIAPATGQNTRATSNSYSNGVLFATTNGSSFTQTVDDLYIADTSGSTNNDFLGDCRIDTLLPNGEGAHLDFTPSTGTTHYLLVDEATPNTTDYNESSTAGHRDSYAMVDLSAVTGTIYGVQVSGAILKDDAGARSIKVGARAGGTTSVGTAQTLSTSQLYYSAIHETNPATGVAWTESGVNGAEAVFEIV